MDTRAHVPTLLVLVAHPDDEVMMGGTLAKYAAEGSRVILVCATRGEVGEISDPSLATAETLGEVREAEVGAAAAALGVSDVRFLGFRDSGMAGTPANDDPRSFTQASANEAVSRLVALLRDVQPDVVITHDPTGGYGHPDHLACHRHMTQAVEVAGDPAQFPEHGPAWSVARFYWMVMARSWFLTMREQMAALGEESGFEGFDLNRFGYDDDQITTVIDVSAYLDAKNRAFEAHQTQFGGDNRFRRLPDDVIHRMMSTENFVMARPAPAPGAPRSADLFL
ncbi:MAG: PIG-L family deacetylase [Anaerolineae bacterium]|nr:PIG-L family deacetylase [Anaerolineae bacterium]